MDSKMRVLGRREFLGAAAAGAAIVASGSAFSPYAKDEAKPRTPDMFVCGICGHVEFGSAPQVCPVCHAPKDTFTAHNSIFEDAQSKLPDGGVKHTPVIMVQSATAMIPELPLREVSVRVGQTMHPMEEKHHIKFIDIYFDDKFINRFAPNLLLYPAVSLYMKPEETKVRVIEWCTLHGYWQAASHMN
jgi:desulfoferrodoxin-like iron-binding protein